MKYLVMADIHSNLNALKKVLEVEKPNAYIIAGDILGYGPYPNEVSNIIISLKNAVVVAGNHDYACMDLKSLEWFNEYAKSAINWQKNVIKDEYKKFYAFLPVAYKNELFEVYHGSPREPLDEYLLEEWQFIENLNYIKKNIVFIGHSHIPFYAEIDNDHNIRLQYMNEGYKLKLDIDKKYFINPGSIGQPRDNNPKASYGIFDTENMTFELKRIEYNIKETYEKIKIYGLPEFLGARLFLGI
ncbi:MAG: metallophosphoesterase family protein [bacterium]|nr:metallophosphoesterase family protein [bacterium]